MKKLALALLLPFAFATMPACTDTEVGVGVGLVGGALIGASIGASYGDYYYDNDYRPYYGCVGYNNYYGSYANECGYGYGYGYGGGYYRHGWYSNSPELMSTKTGPKGVVVSGRAAHFAMKNKVSFTGSERLVQAFDQGAQGNLAPLAKLGMTKEELVAVYDGRMPSSRAMGKLASSLNVSSAKVASMMKTVVAKVQEQRGNY